MIQDFVVADQLHLLELGIMKRLLTGWRDGNLGFAGKMSAYQIQHLSAMIESVKLPKEVHRKMRGIDCLAFWKGTECRTFLNYVGIVVLKGVLNETLYKHFLLLFTAVTICSSDFHANLRPTAQGLFEKFIQEFMIIYGEQYITSNIHNLEHIVGDVDRFGSLNTISAYPFESYLSQIKNFVRQGNNCLEQVVNRLLEKNEQLKQKKNFTPKVTRRGSFVQCEIKNGLLISNTFKDSCFLAKNLDIVQMTDATIDIFNNITIHGSPVSNFCNFFDFPIPSSKLYIFLTNLCISSRKAYTINEMFCKFVVVPYTRNNVVLLPLLHTFCAD
ncbi:uncharacterized protein LOC129731407 isoform X1 [Wyeomyia smithii]|uniref:uncharacterized protein LOC129731407 isoform X1 n=1 Tax=Wyeomyia smithii TaxID=174621 RepID=UPI002467F89B|nr:uncharacterized protein LOC129731407 isoform X1 [Wyeomyia smithii]XP_055547362.1 uncharacterized protein LOC129731407 isoform X1 [Wyeomyia smithii]